MKLLPTISCIALFTAALSAADAPSAAKVFDNQLRNMEHEFVPLVEAMPADKFGFAPSEGAFKGVRTFAMQSKHVAFVLHQVSAALLGEKNPSAGGKDENGPEDVKSKDQVVKYVKEAFAYAHKAVATLTNDNMLQETADPFSPTKKRTRVDSVSILLWHSFDHYGQMVEYARMNGVIPPASR
ncbi:MAG: DinB family protein [Bryobacteraceae bacterium]